jgi:hypothetical protein
MKTRTVVIGYIAAALIFAFGTYAWWMIWQAVKPTHTHEVQVIERTITEELDYDRIRTLLIDPTNINPDLEDDLAAECAWSIAQNTGEPYMGIALHVQRRWEGDSCAALENLLTHGTY